MTPCMSTPRMVEASASLREKQRQAARARRALEITYSDPLGTLQGVLLIIWVYALVLAGAAAIGN
jgi:hypothetical protein